MKYLKEYKLIRIQVLNKKNKIIEENNYEVHKKAKDEDIYEFYNLVKSLSNYEIYKLDILLIKEAVHKHKKELKFKYVNRGKYGQIKYKKEIK